MRFSLRFMNWFLYNYSLFGMCCFLFYHRFNAGVSDSLSISLLQGKKLAVCSAATKSSVILCLESLIGIVSLSVDVVITVGVSVVCLFPEHVFVNLFHLPYFRTAFKGLIASLLVRWLLLKWYLCKVFVKAFWLI